MAGKKKPDIFNPPTPMTLEEVENFVKRDCVKVIQVISGMLLRVSRVADAKRTKLDLRIRMMEHGANLSKSYAALTMDVLEFVQAKDKTKVKVPELTKPTMFEESQEEIDSASNGVVKTPVGVVD